MLSHAFGDGPILPGMSRTEIRPPIPLAPFHLLEPVGRGATATVWRAVHDTTGTPVAIKILTHALWRSQGRGGPLEREVRTLARLDHPAVVPVHDYGWLDAGTAARIPKVEPGSPYIVMRWFEGGTLQDHLPHLDFERFQAICLRVLDGLAHLHARGLIHRDIKPANVLMGPTGAVISDLGTVYSMIDADQLETGVCGTPAYIAPEQVTLQGWHFGPWTDLYGLGCMAWTMLTGAAPFGHGTRRKTMTARLSLAPPAFTPRFAVPGGIEGWLRRLLARRPAERFRFAADAARALLAVAPRSGPPLAWPDEALEASVNLAETLRLNATTDASETALMTLEALTWDDSVDLDDSSLGEAPPDGLDLAALLRDEGLRDWREPERTRHRALPGCGRNLARLRGAPMTGRLPLRDRLWGHLGEVARTGRARVLCLAGGPGFGKTRLLEWLGHRAHELGYAETLWVKPREHPFDDSGLWAMLTRQVIDPEATLREIALRLSARLGLSDEVARVVAAASGDRLADDSAASAVAAPIEERGAFAALLTAASTMARHRPMLIAIDDAHLDDVALRFALQVLDHQPEIPALLVVAADQGALSRDAALGDRYADLVMRSPEPLLEVAPLERGAIGAIVDHRLRLQPALRDALVTRAAGRPQYAMLALERWLDMDALLATDAGYRLRSEATTRWPRDLVDAWTMRLDHLLGPRYGNARAALELAATLGSPAERGHWQAACAQAGLPRAEDALAEVLDAGLAHVDDGARLALADPLMTRALIARAKTTSRLKRWHAICAEVLIADDRGGPNRSASIASHLAAAGRSAEAITYWRRAARGAFDRGQVRRAETQLIAAARACRATGSPRTGPDWIAIKVLWVRCGYVRHDAARVIRHGQQGAQLAIAGRAHREAISLLRAVAVTLRSVGELDRMAAIIERIEQVSRLVGDRAALGDCARLRAEHAVSMGRHDEAWALINRAADMTVGDTGRDRCQILNTLSDFARYRGVYDVAIAAAAEALTLAHNPGAKAIYTLNLGKAHLANGDFAEARRLVEDARWQAVKINTRVGMTACDTTLLFFAGVAADAEAWDRTWAGLDLVRSLSFAELDVARDLESAARAAGAALPQRARAAAELALAVYTHLGREGAIPPLRAWLAALDSGRR